MKRRDVLKVLAAVPAVAAMGEATSAAPAKAAILSTELGADLLRQMVSAARAAGFAEVVTLERLPEVGESGEREARQYHLPRALEGVSVIVLDEWIGGRSAFEVLAILKATVESKRIATFMLAETPRESTVFAAHSAGVDCFLAKPFAVAEFQKFMGHLRESRAAGGKA